MDDYNNKKELVKRSIVISQLETLSETFAEDCEPAKRRKREKQYGYPIEYVAGFSMGLSFAQQILEGSHIPTPVLAMMGISYMRECVDGED